MQKQSNIPQQILPQDRDTELNVLGTIINNDGYFSKVEDILNSDAFYDNILKGIFRCVKYLLINNKIADTTAIIDTSKRFAGKLDATINDYDVMEVVARDCKETFIQDVERIVEYGQRRKAWEILTKAQQRILSLSDDATETMTTTISKIDDIKVMSVVDSDVVDAMGGLQVIYNQINDNINGINKSSINTGFTFTDAKGGLRTGTLVVIGAFTSVGKTSLALNMALNIAKQNIPVAFYSLEMSVSDLWARIICEHTGIPAWKIQGYALKREEIAQIDHATRQLQNIPLYIDDKATTSFERMLRSVRYMVKRYGIKMFVVDYLQIFAQTTRGEKEEAMLASMARACKNISKELNIVCILLSQLRRAGESKHPTFDMLRGSGQIEESADNIILIDRPDAHPDWGVTSFKNNKTIDVHGKAEINVGKGRNIGTGCYYVNFDDSRFVFYEDNQQAEQTNTNEIEDPIEPTGEQVPF